MAWHAMKATGNVEKAGLFTLFRFLDFGQLVVKVDCLACLSSGNEFIDLLKCEYIRTVKRQVATILNWVVQLAFMIDDDHGSVTFTIMISLWTPFKIAVSG